MKRYKPNDRVMSLVYGYYNGIPGTILERAQVQYNKDTRYVVHLDCGEYICLHASQIDYYSDESR